MSAAGVRTFLRQTACECPHTAKHHKRSGRCRKGCECKRAQVKALIKQRRNVHA